MWRERGSLIEQIGLFESKGKEERGEKIKGEPAKRN